MDTEIKGILQLWKRDMGTISGVGQKASCTQNWIYCQYFVHSLHNWNSVLYWRKKENLEKNVPGHNYNAR